MGEKKKLLEILVVEGDFDTSFNLGLSISRAIESGIVDTAGTRQDALRKISAIDFELIVTADYLPERELFGDDKVFCADEICEAAKRKNPDSLVIAYSTQPERLKADFDQKYNKRLCSPKDITDKVGEYIKALKYFQQ